MRLRRRRGRSQTLVDRRKRSVVLRLLRGEPVDAVSREVGVTIAELEQWRELALAGMEAGLKTRTSDPLEAGSMTPCDAWASCLWKMRSCARSVNCRLVAL